MPLPKPKPTEKRAEFIVRCMDDDTMKSEYKDTEQRYAVCVAQYVRNYNKIEKK